MIGMAFIFSVLIVVIAFTYNMWSQAGKEERAFVLIALFKATVFASIAFVILFVIVNLF
jgi:hypothetical protein